MMNKTLCTFFKDLNSPKGNKINNYPEAVNRVEIIEGVCFSVNKKYVWMLHETQIDDVILTPYYIEIDIELMRSKFHSNSTNIIFHINSLVWKIINLSFLWFW